MKLTVNGVNKKITDKVNVIISNTFTMISLFDVKSITIVQHKITIISNNTAGVAIVRIKAFDDNITSLQGNSVIIADDNNHIKITGIYSI